MLRVIVHVPHLGDKTFRFTSWRTVIGRSRSCDLTLVSSQVSKSHAAIEIIDGVISIRDLGSRNGVVVNGNKIIRQHALFANDQILLGDVSITIDERSKIFEMTPNRQVVGIIVEERLIRDSIAGQRLDPSQRPISGVPIEYSGSIPVLRMLRITEDYIPRTAFRITPFLLQLDTGEHIWIWPRLEIAPLELNGYQRLENILYDEREDLEVPIPGRAVLMRDYYRLPRRIYVHNIVESGLKEGLRVFSERSEYEKISIRIADTVQS